MLEMCQFAWWSTKFTLPQKSLFLQPPWAPKFAIAPLSLNTKPPEVMKSQGAFTKCADTVEGAVTPIARATSAPASEAPGIHLRAIACLLCRLQLGAC